MHITMSKNDLQRLVFGLTGLAVDELELLETIKRFSDDIVAITSAKILFLVGSGRLYPVAGVSFDNKQDIIKKIQTGDILYFEKEPDNEFDKNAIKVIFATEHIGYIPKKIAIFLNDCIDELCGEVVHVVGGEEDKNLGLRFAFRRKSSINQKQIVNIDTVQYLLEDIVNTNGALIADAQMANIMSDDHKVAEVPQEVLESIPCLASTSQANSVEPDFAQSTASTPATSNTPTVPPKKEEDIF